MLAAMHVMAALGGQAGPLSALAEAYMPYSASARSTRRRRRRRRAGPRRAGVRDRAGRGPVTVDELDGLTISHWESTPRWWFNLRASNTEPLLRLNVEAADEDIMTRSATTCSRSCAPAPWHDEKE